MGLLLCSIVFLVLVTSTKQLISNPMVRGSLTIIIVIKINSPGSEAVQQKRFYEIVLYNISLLVMIFIVKAVKIKNQRVLDNEGMQSHL